MESGTNSRPDSRPPKKNRRGKFIICLAVAFAGLCLFMYDGNNRIEITNIAYESDRLPPAFDGFRVVHISDLHAKEYGAGNADLFRIVREQSPDLIVITGDIIQANDETPYVETTVKGLRKIAQVCYVTGNHEWEARAVPKLRQIFTRDEYLSNRYIKLERDGQYICLLGIEDLNGPWDMPTIDQTVIKLRDKEGDPFIMALCHRYDRFEDFVDCRLDLVFSGHAHGGLVRLPFTDGLLGPGRILFPKHTSGITFENQTAMVTSRGLGNGTVIPYRLLNNPELVVVDLKSKSEN